jgi:hypothetical protein
LVWFYGEKKPLDPGLMDRQWIASMTASLLIKTGYGEIPGLVTWEPMKDSQPGLYY